MADRKLRRCVLPFVLVATVVLTATMYAHTSASLPTSSEGQQIGKILSVRKVLQNHYFVSRYPQIHYYLLYLAVRTSDQTYCVEYETPVLDEIDDLFSAKDRRISLATSLHRAAMTDFGTAYAGGCTSGHAMSGLADLQLSSLIAVLGFFAGGLIATHFILRFFL